MTNSRKCIEECVRECVASPFRGNYQCIFECSSVVAGRAPNSKRLNLEDVGVELDKTGAIVVSNRLFYHLLVFFNFPLSQKT